MNHIIADELIFNALKQLVKRNNKMQSLTADNGDKEYPLDKEAFIVWAIGRLDAVKEPSFHDFYPKGDISVQFNSKEKINNCFRFTR